MAFVRIACVVGALAFFLSSSESFALNQIYLTPSSQSVLLGDVFTVNLMMNFDDVTVGGGVEVTYDNLVVFQSFAFDTNFVGNFGLTGPPDDETSQPLEVGFGFFFGSPPYGASGLHHVGTFSFLAAGYGATQLITTAASATSPGPFYSPTDSNNPLPVSFNGASVLVSPVPEPSTALLLGLGLIGLGARQSFSPRGNHDNRTDTVA